MEEEENNVEVSGEAPEEAQAEAPDQSGSAEAETPATESGEVQAGLSGPEEQPEESAFRKGLRRFLRALAMAVILFGLGMLFMFYVFQRPRIQTLNDQVQTLQAENQGLSDQVESLQNELDALGDVASENEALEESLAESQVHVRLLAVLADVRAAQVSLSGEDGDLARSQLTGVPEALEALGELLPSERQGELDAMLNRANLVIEEIETDTFAAQSDLEVLANSLIQLENSLFVLP